MERSIKDTVASSVKPSRQERPVPPEVLSLMGRYESMRLKGIIKNWFRLGLDVEEQVRLKHHDGSFHRFLETSEVLTNINTTEYIRSQLRKFVQGLSWNPFSDTVTLTLDSRGLTNPAPEATQLTFSRTELGNMAVFDGVEDSLKHEKSQLYDRLVQAILKSCLTDPSTDKELTRFLGADIITDLFQGTITSISSKDVQDLLKSAWQSRAEDIATRLYLALTLYFDVEPHGTPPAPADVAAMSRIPWYMNSDKSIKVIGPGGNKG